MRYVLIAVLLLGACGGDDNTGPARIEVEGSWQGIVTFSSGSKGSMTMTLTETGGAVTGNGTTTGPGGSVSEAITGTYVPPNVSLSLHTEGFEDTNVSAVVGESQMTGTISGSGFSGSPITFNRQ